MIVHGCYTKDENFTTVLSGGVMYTIARNTGDWGSVKVGGRTASGHVLTKKEYNRLKSECDMVGTFKLD